MIESKLILQSHCQESCCQSPWLIEQQSLFLGTPKDDIGTKKKKRESRNLSRNYLDSQSNPCKRIHEIENVDPAKYIGHKC